MYVSIYRQSTTWMISAPAFATPEATVPIPTSATYNTNIQEIYIIYIYTSQHTILYIEEIDTRLFVITIALVINW